MTAHSPVPSSGDAKRRTLRFETLEQALGEARRLAALEAEGRAAYAGNWTVGQILNHLGAWAEYSFTPNPLKVPWVVRVLMRAFKRRLLTRGMSPGRRIPGVEGGTLATQRVAAEEGLARLTRAYARLQQETPTQASPLLGKLTQEEAIQLNLRHAELHLSFVNEA